MRKPVVIAIFLCGALSLVGVYLFVFNDEDRSGAQNRQSTASETSSPPHRAPTTPRATSSPRPGSTASDPRRTPSSPRSAVPSADAETSVDAEKLSQYVGRDTAKALAGGGPYRPKHARTIAHSLNQMEKQIDELRREGAPPERLHALSEPYFDLQNQYYAVLDELEPYEPDKKSARRLAEFEEKLEREGHRLAEDEREELKRKMLLSPNNKDSGSTR